MRSVVVAALASVALGCQSDTFGTDGGPDGGTDDAPADAPSDAGPQPCPFVPFDGGDKCGQDKCNAGDDCCVSSSQTSCTSQGNCTSGIPLACRKPLDCAVVTADAGVAQVCCLTYNTETVGCPTLVGAPASASCVLVTKCNAPSERLCVADVDCRVQQHCSRAILAGNAAVVVGVCF